jgi:hypothetical protein
MTVADLLERLEDLPEDAEVRLTFQPSWPLVFHLGDVAEGAGECEDCEGEGRIECPDCGGDTNPDAPPCDTCNDNSMVECRCADTRNDAEPEVIYLAAGNHPDDSPYLPGDASRALGWR